MNKKKVKLLIALVVIIGGIGALVYSSMKSTVTYYMKPSEILAKARADGKAVYGERVRVGGIVINKTVKGSAATRKWEFMVTDGREDKIVPVAMVKTTPENRLLVKYKGIVPDTFKEGVMAISDGILSKDGVFTADTVMAKCPSKYEASQQKEKEMAKKGAADKKAGRAAPVSQ
ncbi:MAG: cytochrome c maturation protein CcmE [Actinomycetota bacterium]|nr:cytochrome c maturation protein CcmE [Actinomycetota bacterium]